MRNPHAQRCSAKTTKGNPCAHWAIRGGTVCTHHGGSAPQVRQAARLRLAALVDPAIDVLLKHLKPKNGRVVNAALQVTVARDALDRNGLKSKDEVVITQEATRYSHLSDEDLAQLVSLVRKSTVPTDASDVSDT